jgi:hypothetical protein
VRKKCGASDGSRKVNASNYVQIGVMHADGSATNLTGVIVSRIVAATVSPNMEDRRCYMPKTWRLTMANTLQTRTRTSTPARSDPVISLCGSSTMCFATGARGDPQTGTMMMPNIDISETDSELKIRAELSGVSEQDVEVILSDDILTIRAESEFEREEDKEDYHLPK